LISSIFLSKKRTKKAFFSGGSRVQSAHPKGKTKREAIKMQEIKVGMEIKIGGIEYYCETLADGRREITIVDPNWHLYKDLEGTIHHHAASNRAGTNWGIFLGNRKMLAIKTDDPKKVAWACMECDAHRRKLQECGLIQ
jgi:hypothetical protein